MENNTSLPQSLHSLRRYYRPIEPILTKPQNRVYTATILSFLVVSLFLWYAVKPTMQTIFALRREIKDNIEISKQMEEKISALVQAQATYQSISQDIPLISEALPRNPDPILALISLRNLANKVDATISAIQIPEIELTGNTATPAGMSGFTPGDPQRIGFSITAEGRYASLRQFMEGLLSMRRITTIQDISINPITTDAINLADPDLRGALRLNIYFLPGGDL